MLGHTVHNNSTFTDVCGVVSQSGTASNGRAGGDIFCPKLASTIPVNVQISSCPIGTTLLVAGESQAFLRCWSFVQNRAMTHSYYDVCCVCETTFKYHPAEDVCRMAMSPQRRTFPSYTTDTSTSSMRTRIAVLVLT